MSDLVHNRVLLAAILASVLAQVIKVLLTFLMERRWDWSRLYESGGMPSSHTAAVTALTVGVGLREGMGGSFFAAVAVFAYIIVYDATNLRRATGRHAELLNEFVELFQHLFDKDDQPERLKTLLGHSYPQALVGLLIGAGVGFLLCS
jgi:acid phosphatase family membrane protein YuiD